MSTFLIVSIIGIWLVAAIVVGLVIGRAIRARDRQRSLPEPRPPVPQPPVPQPPVPQPPVLRPRVQRPAPERRVPEQGSTEQDFPSHQGP